MDCDIDKSGRNAGNHSDKQYTDTLTQFSPFIKYCIILALGVQALQRFDNARKK